MAERDTLKEVILGYTQNIGNFFMLSNNLLLQTKIIYDSTQ